MQAVQQLKRLLWVLVLLYLLFVWGVQSYAKHQAQGEAAQLLRVRAEVQEFLPCGGRKVDCRLAYGRHAKQISRAKLSYAAQGQTYTAKLRAPSEGLRLGQRLDVWTRPGWVWAYRSPQDFVASKSHTGLTVLLLLPLGILLMPLMSGFFWSKPEEPRTQAEDMLQNK